MDRRTVLKTLGAAGAALALPAGAARAAGPGAREGGGRVELATLLDLSKCIGCGACVEACAEANARKKPEPKKPFPKMYPSRVKVEDWSERRDVDDRLTPYNWLYIQSAEVEKDGEALTVNIPRRCLHCVNPPCANLCPWGAALKQANGIVRINDEVCLGGSKCRSVCPWTIPQRQTGVGAYLDLLPSLAGNGVMYKCDRCYDRVERGEVPACIEVCPMDVQSIGPREEIVARARALAEETGGHIYGLEENGGTNTIYVSPVPFSELDAALDKAGAKGPGRPHLRPVKDMMARDGALASAMALAPVAGVAAGLITFVRSMKNRGGDDDA
ncbi:4Fe-4S dicluster domain-containing protein [Desulfocurvus sp. DL9XJH121]